MEKEVKSLEELRSVAKDFLQRLANKPQHGEATVVGLSGDLGAGKTAFVKCVADILGINETITSPTFILEKMYAIPRGSVIADNFTKLIHIDAYRLEGGKEMNALGWKDISADPQNLILIEWPEQVADAMPSTMKTISFEYIDENARKITL